MHFYRYFSRCSSIFSSQFKLILSFSLLLSSCKSAEKVEYEDSELASSPNKQGFFAGVPPKTLRETAHNIRMTLIDANLAGCSVPFADQYKDTFNPNSAEEEEFLEREVNRLGLELMKEERPGNPLQAMITVTAAQGALKYLNTVGQPVLDELKKNIDKISKPAQTVDVFVQKAAQGSQAIVNFFHRVSKRLGPRSAFQALKIAVPQITAVEHGVRTITDLTGKAAGVTRNTYNLLVSLSAGLGYLKVILRYAPAAAGAIGDNFVVCNITHSLIKSLEVIELEATINDPLVAKEKKAALLPKFCALLAARKPKAPIINQCRPKKRA